MSDTTGQLIATDIAAADAVLSPLITAFNPVVGAGVSLGLKLLAQAEPAIYNAVIAVLQGTPLTPAQTAALADIETKLQNPGQYFA